MAAICKPKKTTTISLLFLLGILSTSLFIPGNLPAQETEKVSRFGEYKGYSEEIYDSSVRTSRYLTMRDGIKIAIDIKLPAIKDKVEEEPLPVIWTHTRYRRASIRGGKVLGELDSPLYTHLLKRGYVLAAADVRGSGASFGSWQGITTEEAKDAYEITAWLASQTWCDGNVGMLGGSYLGITQLMAASTNPPQLKAIFPVVAMFDLYHFSYMGGVFYHDWHEHWSKLTAFMDTERVAAPVDGEEGEPLLRAAVAEHKTNRSIYDILSPLKFRNSIDEVTGSKPYYEWLPSGYVKEINQSGIPIYQWCGWFDSFTKDGILMYRNFTTPNKLAMSAMSHSSSNPKIIQEVFTIGLIEMQRWFDYWLKDIDNGIMEEPDIHYHVMKTPNEWEWRTTDEWPLPEQSLMNYYFHEGPSGSVESVNDGKLSTERTADNSAKDDYVVDYTTTSGTATRWDNAVGEGFDYSGIGENDKKGLTYTTDVLGEDLEITGHPIVHLWVSSTATDGDFFVYLEEVDAEGISHYVSEGVLRASHRAIHEPHYDYLGLPFHRSHEEDVVELTPGEIAELVFDLQPTSNVFNAGNRIRITITCADKDSASTPELSPPPTVSVYRNTQHASHVILPVISASTKIQTEDESPLALVLGIALGIIVFVIIFTTFMKRRLHPKP